LEPRLDRSPEQLWLELQLLEQRLGKEERRSQDK
jgi:hypothetical protein